MTRTPRVITQYRLPKIMSMRKTRASIRNKTQTRKKEKSRGSSIVLYISAHGQEFNDTPANPSCKYTQILSFSGHIGVNGVMEVDESKSIPQSTLALLRTVINKHYYKKKPDYKKIMTDLKEPLLGRI